MVLGASSPHPRLWKRGQQFGRRMRWYGQPRYTQSTTSTTSILWYLIAHILQFSFAIPRSRRS
jgi:hypothetical protein